MTKFLKQKYGCCLAALVTSVIVTPAELATEVRIFPNGSPKSDI